MIICDVTICNAAGGFRSFSSANQHLVRSDLWNYSDVGDDKHTHPLLQLRTDTFRCHPSADQVLSLRYGHLASCNFVRATFNPSTLLPGDAIGHSSLFHPTVVYRKNEETYQYLNYDAQTRQWWETDAGTGASISVSLLYTKLIIKLNFNITFWSKRATLA